MATTSNETGPVLDANGDPVPLPDYIKVDNVVRAFMRGRVPAACGHYIAKSEADVGLDHCERCGPDQDQWPPYAEIEARAEAANLAEREATGRP